MNNAAENNTQKNNNGIRGNVCSIQGVDIMLKLFFGKDLGKKSIQCWN